MLRLRAKRQPNVCRSLVEGTHIEADAFFKVEVLESRSGLRIATAVVFIIGEVSEEFSAFRTEPEN
jgi:hypothetical protein